MNSKTLIFSALSLLTGQVLAYTLPDQAPVKGYECTSCANLSHEKLAMSWAIADLALGHESMHQQESRKFQVKTTLKALQKGVAIQTQAPGAVIRISPVNPNETMKPQFQIKSAKTKTLPLIDASSLFSKEEGLKDTAFADNTLAIAKLKPELGAGEFIVSLSPTKTLAQSDEDSSYLIHVFDAESYTQLITATDKAHYSYGDELRATISLKDKYLKYTIDKIAVTLISPDLKEIPLEAKPIDPSSYEVKYKLNSETNDKGENWYIKADVEGSAGQRLITRLGRTAISYTIPSAALREISKTAAGSFDFAAKIEVATDSRYALQAVLFGSDEKGKLHPIQTVQTAAWLPAGLNNFNFSFDSTLKSDYKEPYYLGYLRLTDFGQQKPVFSYDKPIELSNLG